jgi:tRNA(Glu) U13 pseudouridine synthase TruD
MRRTNWWVETTLHERLKRMGTGEVNYHGDFVALTSLLANKFDVIIASMTITPERKEKQTSDHTMSTRYHYKNDNTTTMVQRTGRER